MEELLLLASISSNVVTSLPFIIRKAKNCTLDEAWEFEKKYSCKLIREFAEYVTGTSFNPTPIGLLNDPEFVESIRVDWKKLSSISIDVLKTREGFFTVDLKSDIKGFQYIQIEFVGTPENQNYFLVSVENHIRRQLQMYQYQEPLVHSFCTRIKDNINHVICNFYYSSNSKEHQTLEQYIVRQKTKEKQHQFQTSGLESVVDPELQQELENV